jgi:hypothetical protein
MEDMALEREIWLSYHAYERYCERVEPIGWRELEQLIAELMRSGFRYKDGYIRTGDVWWRGEVTRDHVMLHTCYGVTHIDIPDAIKWAKLHKDRLDLEKDSGKW